MGAFVYQYENLYVRNGFYFISILIFYCHSVFTFEERKEEFTIGKYLDVIILAKLRYDTTVLDIQKAFPTLKAKEIIRIVPNTFKLEQQLASLQNEMYEKIEAESLKKQNESTCHCFAQIFGQKRDLVYYEKHIEGLEDKLKKANLKLNKSAFIIEFNNSLEYGEFLSQVKNVKVNRTKPKIIKNIHQSNILLQNLDHNNFERFFRWLLTIFISVGVSALLCAFLVYYRGICRKWKDKSSNWLVQQLIYYSSYLIVIGFDQALRPILRWAASFEKMQYVDSQERDFYFKYYFYELINRFTIFLSRTWSGRSPNLFSMVKTTEEWRYGEDSIGMDLVNIFLLEVFGYNLADLLCSVIIKLYFLGFRDTERGKQQYYNGYPVRFASLYTNFSVMQALLISFAGFVPAVIPIFQLYCVLQSLVTRYRLLRITAQPPITSSLSHEYQVNQYLNCLLAIFVQYLSYGESNVRNNLMLVGELAAFVAASIVLHNVINKQCRPFIAALNDEDVENQSLTEKQPLTLRQSLNFQEDKYTQAQKDELLSSMT